MGTGRGVCESLVLVVQLGWGTFAESSKVLLGDCPGSGPLGSERAWSSEEGWSEVGGMGRELG